MTPGEPLPARGVCGAKRAPNGQLGFMLSNILDAVSDLLAKRDGTECNSTEGMLASIEEKINKSEVVKNLVVFSSDVKAIYPSLLAEQCSVIISRLVQESELVVEGVHWDEAVDTVPGPPAPQG